MLQLVTHCWCWRRNLRVRAISFKKLGAQFLKVFARSSIGPLRRATVSDLTVTVSRLPVAEG